MLVVFIWVVVGLLGLQLLLLTLLIGSKMRSLHLEKMVENEIETMSLDFFAYIAGSTDIEPQPNVNLKLQPLIVEELLNRISPSILEEPAKKRLSALAEKYLAVHYRSRLKKGKWADRINALYFIEDFGIASLREDVYVHYRGLKKQDEEFRQCLLTATSLQEERLLNDILEHENLSAGLIKELLFRLEERHLVEMMKRIEVNADISETVLFAFMTFIGDQRKDRFHSFIEKKMFDERKEVRLKAMNSLSNFEKISNPQLLSSFFSSEYWEERMYAAKLTGACSLDQFKSSLIGLLSDSVWWVRFSAADNLHKLDGGEAILAEVSIEHQDGYARDIAKHMLTRRGGKGK